MINLYKGSILMAVDDCEHCGTCLECFDRNNGLTIILLQVTIMTLSEEKTPLISLLKPLLWQLNSSHLKPKEADSETARSFKEALSESLSERLVIITH
jgi:hypothetical protein